MSPEDQKLYGQTTITVRKLDRHASTKTATAERKEQASFANWLLLQNSKRGPKEKIPFVWHATHTPSKATPGTPDFWVGIRGRSIWIEFKASSSCKLTLEQEEFRRACEVQGIEWDVVYSAEQAIGLCSWL